MQCVRKTIEANLSFYLGTTRCGLSGQQVYQRQTVGVLNDIYDLACLMASSMTLLMHNIYYLHKENAPSERLIVAPADGCNALPFAYVRQYSTVGVL